MQSESGGDLQPTTPPSIAKEKMLKSLTRVGDHPLGQFNGNADAAARRPATVTPKKGPLESTILFYSSIDSLIILWIVMKMIVHRRWKKLQCQR